MENSLWDKRDDNQLDFYGRENIGRSICYEKKGKFHARCFFGLGVEGQIAIDWLDLHLGQTICRDEFNQTEIFVTDTSNPQRNPYRGSMDKKFYGIGGTFRSELRPTWSVRIFGTVQIVDLRIFDSNKSENPGNITFQTLGAEINLWH